MQYAKDNTLYCMCLSNGKGVILNFKGGVYRQHSGGTYSNATEFDKTYKDFLFLDELISEIPACNIPYMHAKRSLCLDKAFYLVSHRPMDTEGFQDMLSVNK